MVTHFAIYPDAEHGQGRPNQRTSSLLAEQNEVAHVVGLIIVEVQVATSQGEEYRPYVSLLRGLTKIQTL